MLRAMIMAASLTAAAGAAAAAPVSIPSEPGDLHGTLLAPDSVSAVAVIVPGSGPTDRDGNNPMGVRAATYRLLAEALAERGIATVRFDKRGIGQSAGAATSEADLRFGHYADDTLAWARQAAERTGQDCAWLIGHSEGALIAQAAAAEGGGDVCGLALIAGAGRPAAELVREQLATLPDALKAQAEAALAELVAGRTVPASPPGLEALFRPSVQPYLISWFALDPAALIGAYSGPVMIGQGAADMQVTLADAQALAAAQPAAHLVEWDGVNHVLKPAPADPAANLATYADPDLPLAPGVADDIADFILQPR